MVQVSWENSKSRTVEEDGQVNKPEECGPLSVCYTPLLFYVVSFYICPRAKLQTHYQFTHNVRDSIIIVNITNSLVFLSNPLTWQPKLYMPIAEQEVITDSHNGYVAIGDVS